MFEKEAEEWVKTKGTDAITCLKENIGWDDVCKQAFQDGAEFGYNKANEWHFVKDGLTDELAKKSDTNHRLVEQLAEQNEELTEAKELLKTCVALLGMFNSSNGSVDNLIAKVEAFLKE